MNKLIELNNIINNSNKEQYQINFLKILDEITNNKIPELQKNMKVKIIEEFFYTNEIDDIYQNIDFDILNKEKKKISNELLYNQDYYIKILKTNYFEEKELKEFLKSKEKEYLNRDEMSLLDLDIIINNQKLSEEFLNDILFTKKIKGLNINLSSILKNQKLSANLIIKLIYSKEYMINFSSIIKFQELSEDFFRLLIKSNTIPIKNYLDKIFQYQKLDEKTIDLIIENVGFEKILKGSSFLIKQNLSENILNRIIKDTDILTKINVNDLLSNQKLNDEQLNFISQSTSILSATTNIRVIMKECLYNNKIDIELIMKYVDMNKENILLVLKNQKVNDEFINKYILPEYKIFKEKTGENIFKETIKNQDLTSKQIKLMMNTIKTDDENIFLEILKKQNLDQQMIDGIIIKISELSKKNGNNIEIHEISSYILENDKLSNKIKEKYANYIYRKEKEITVLKSKVILNLNKDKLLKNKSKLLKMDKNFFFKMGIIKKFSEISIMNIKKRNNIVKKKIPIIDIDIDSELYF